MPDGDYLYEDYLEFYNQGRLDPVLARIKLTVAGDQLIADFEGTNPQVPGVVNCSLAVAGAGVFVAVKATLDPGGAVNEGAFRPITLKAPEASIFDVRSDAPAGAHGEVRKRAVSLTMGALAQVIPDLVCGDLCGSSFPNAIGGWNQRRNRQYVYYKSPAGGNGGFAGGDGPSAFVNIDFGNLPSIHNVESIENEMPLLVESCALRIDGGGEGQQRGGVGMVRRIRVLDDEASYSVLSDRAVLPPWGVHGGASAAPYHLSIERGTETIDVRHAGQGDRLSGVSRRRRGDAFIGRRRLWRSVDARPWPGATGRLARHGIEAARGRRIWRGARCRGRGGCRRDRGGARVDTAAAALSACRRG